MTVLSPEEIRADLVARYPAKGKISQKGLSREQLAKWGVPWPPRKGWLTKLKADCGFQRQRPPAKTPAEIPDATPVLTPKLTVTIYTDGACIGNPGPGGWAAILTYGERRRKIVGSEPDTTNNRMELLAAISALEALKQPCHVLLHTDSQYLINGITKWIKGWQRDGWKRKPKKGVEQPVLNVDLWQRLDAARQRHDVQWIWVKGHAGTVENERADTLAQQAAWQVSASSDPVL